MDAHVGHTSRVRRNECVWVYESVKQCYMICYHTGYCLWVAAKTCNMLLSKCISSTFGLLWEAAGRNLVVVHLPGSIPSPVSYSQNSLMTTLMTSVELSDPTPQWWFRKADPTLCTMWYGISRMSTSIGANRHR